MEDSYGIVYKATNIKNGLVYIGQTIQGLDTRKAGHISNAFGSQSSLYFHRAIRKYGKDNFTWEVIDEAETKDELSKKEMYWIEFYNSYKGDGYNATYGGDSVNSGIKQSDEQKMKHSLAHGGKPFFVFDLDGNLLGERVMQKVFADEIGCCVQSVNDALHNKLGKISVKKRILIFKDEFTQEKLLDKLEHINYKQFYVFNTDGEYIGKWNNQKMCSTDLKIANGNISKCLNKKSSHIFNYKFYYLKDIPENLRDLIKEVK